MSKITLATVGSISQNPTSAATLINDNFDTIQTAFDNTLSRDGTQPNPMENTLDMNSLQIINLPVPATANSPLRLQDLETFNGGGTIANIPPGGTTGQVLAKNSNTDFDTGWDNSVTSVGLALPADFTITGSPVTTTGTLTGAWATTPTGTGAVVRAQSPTVNAPTVTGHMVVEGITATGATGTGKFVFDTSPTLTTPNLGTPSAGVMTNVTGTASGLTAGNVTTNANLTGVITSVGNATSIASQTGTGTKFVVDTSPVLVTPNLGTPSAAVLTNASGTAASLTAGHVTTNANLTGPITSSGNATSVAAQTGTGSTFVMQTSPSLTTPALGTPSSGTLTSCTGLPLSGLTTQAANTVVGNATGSTASPTAVAPAAARSSSLLNVDQFTGHGDSIYTILTTDRTVGTNAAFTASRTWTLPAASAVNPGQEIIVADYQGTVTVTNTLVISRAGADTVNGGTAVTISAANGAYLLRSDGISKWTAQSMGAASAGGVSSITAGTSLSGGTITTSGTIALNMVTASNVLGSDTSLSNTATFFDGPSMAQGTSGTWFVSGTVTCTDTSAAAFVAQLTDGTTVVSTTEFPCTASGLVSISLSGIFTSPASNIRIQVQDRSNTTGKILHSLNATKNSSIWGIRIA